MTTEQQEIIDNARAARYEMNQDEVLQELSRKFNEYHLHHANQTGIYERDTKDYWVALAYGVAFKLAALEVERLLSREANFSPEIKVPVVR